MLWLLCAMPTCLLTASNLWAGCMAPEQVLSAQQRRTGCSGARWRDARTRTLLLELIHQAPTQVGLTK